MTYRGTIGNYNANWRTSEPQHGAVRLRNGLLSNLAAAICIDRRSRMAPNVSLRVKFDRENQGKELVQQVADGA